MSVLAAAIPVVGNLLGGLFGDRSAKKAAAQQRAWALEDQEQQWVRHRAASEAGGFNPLATLGMGQGVATTAAAGGNYMGEAIAQSSLLLADSLAKAKQKASAQSTEALRMQNSELQRKLTRATLRPTVPGVYQRAQAFGTGGGNAGTGGYTASRDDVAGASGRGGGVSSATRPAGRPLLQVDPVDPRREVENKPVTSGSGFMAVDSPYLPRMWFPTIDGEEPLDLLDLPSYAFGAGQLAYHGGEYLSVGGGRVGRPSRRQEAYWLRYEESTRRWQEERRKARERTEWYNPRLNFNPNHRDGYYYP